MTRKYDYLIYLGRFQPLHIGHIYTIKKALELADNVIIMCGSAHQPRTPKNPFTVEERWNMIKNVPSINPNRISFSFLYDYYNDQKWASEVQRKVNMLVYNPKAKIGLIGCKKDASTYYLSMFPQWDFVEIDHIDLINATDVRKMLFEQGSLINIDPSTGDYLYTFMETDEYKNLKLDHEIIKKCTSEENTIAVTVLAVVVQSGHVIMVRRDARPCEGLLTLPGGYINPHERLLDGIIRELRDTVKLKIPVPVLKGSLGSRDKSSTIPSTHVFDNPYRSLKGRNIAHAFYFELESGELAHIKSNDKTIWIPLSEIEGLRDQIFEDNINIIDHFVSCLGY